MKYCNNRRPHTLCRYSLYNFYCCVVCFGIFIFWWTNSLGGPAVGGIRYSTLFDSRLVLSRFALCRTSAYAPPVSLPRWYILLPPCNVEHHGYHCLIRYWISTLASPSLLAFPPAPEPAIWTASTDGRCLSHAASSSQSCGQECSLVRENFITAEMSQQPDFSGIRFPHRNILLLRIYSTSATLSRWMPQIRVVGKRYSIRSYGYQCSCPR